MILNLTITLLAALTLSSSAVEVSERTPFQEPKAEVIVFLAPKCNICKYYTKNLRELSEEFEAKGFSFTGIFPNAHTSDEDIAAFRSEFKLNFHMQTDVEGLADELGAEVTPEVFVRDFAGDILYSGRIDNSYVRVGKRRRNTSSSDLKDALDAILAGEPIENPTTPAIGCIIERPKK